MIKLARSSSAWVNYMRDSQDYFNARLEMGTLELLSLRLNQYNGIVIDQNNRWQPYFKTEQDLSFFLLKWS